MRGTAWGVLGVDLEDVTDLGAGELLVDPLDDAAGPDLVDEIVGDEALGRLAVAAAVHVEGDDVAGARRPVAPR